RTLRARDQQQVAFAEQLRAQAAARTVAGARDREHVDAVARAQPEPRRRAPGRGRVGKDGDFLQHDVRMRRARRIAAGAGLLVPVVAFLPVAVGVHAPAGTGFTAWGNTG